MTKLHLLNLLSQNPDSDAAMVAHFVGCTPEAAGMSLLRLTRQGLVQRAFDPDDQVLIYSLTAKGLARLQYLSRASAELTR